MRIIGMGNDMVDIRRIEKSIARFDGRFVDRVFTDIEKTYCQSKGSKAANFAKRFAAKEACAKALGTGFAKGVFWKDMGVVNDELGAPVMILSGGAYERMKEITPIGMTAQINLTITDEFPMAQAMVIITALGPND